MTFDLSSALNCKRETRVHISESLLKLLRQPGSGQALNALWEGWQKNTKENSSNSKNWSVDWFLVLFDFVLLCHQMQDLNMLSISSVPSPGLSTL